MNGTSYAEEDIRSILGIDYKCQRHNTMVTSVPKRILLGCTATDVE